MRPRSTSLSSTAWESTPRISSTSSRPTGCRYAMIASVSNAAGLRWRGRSANCARSIGSAYSRRVRNCQPPAMSTSSTPWSSLPSPHASRSSASAARVSASPTSGSSVARSSSVSGRLAANRAASNSFARGLTPDHHRGEGLRLRQPQRAALGQLEQGNERGQYLHDRRPRANEVTPAELFPRGQQGLDPRRRAFHVERPGHDAVQHRLGDERDDTLRGCQEVVQLDLERRGRQLRRRRCVAARELLAAPRRRPLQPQLGLDAQQPGGHLEVVGRLVQAQLADHREELVGDLRDRQIRDVELVLADQVQQQVQRAGKLLQLDDKTRLLGQHRVGRGDHKGKAAGETARPPSSDRAAIMSLTVGQRYTLRALGTRYTSSSTGMNPRRYNWRYRSPAWSGRRCLKTWLPSSGGMGSRLKNASNRFIHIP